MAIPSQTSATVTRQLAQEILVRVARDAAFAERVLHTALSRCALPERDRAMVTELVYGTLRQQGWLDHCLIHHARKPLSSLPLPVLCALRLGAYQLLCMGMPPHSAVHESVALVRRYGKMAGLVNAILRNLVREPPTQDTPTTLAQLATRTHLPLWVLDDMSTRRGWDATCAWANATSQAAPLGLRVNRRKISRAALAQRFIDHGITVEMPSWGFDDCLVVRRAGAVKSLPGFAEGYFTVQDLAANAVAHLAAPVSGAVVLDACAAPGGKATHAAELMDDCGVVLAVDIHAAKTRLIAENSARLGLTSVIPVACDAQDSVALGALLASHGAAQADVVMLDAPCSGLGTLRRNPELRGKQRADCVALAALQARLLDSVAPWVKPGGALVYAVCTVTDLEAEDQMTQFMVRHPDFVVEAPTAAWDSCRDGAFIRTWTDIHGSDSFFAARLRRT